MTQGFVGGKHPGYVHLSTVGEDVCSGVMECPDPHAGFQVCMSTSSYDLSTMVNMKTHTHGKLLGMYRISGSASQDIRLFFTVQFRIWPKY